ncbi:hypothetical protein [Pseudovibrio sp. Tun.PSC04-5.I4]|uniref:hypothetical protein n=1 Tax=Pseudovibrio sp. Tun.PSC04-5.I4 TaxID=1798213 RepID=UPI00088DA21D|nr:hypothetical protein [Pseudovibrio sp. Tun.PSC04-5.I4]SDQ99613.1 hypothetical protein SAMN04515695_2230 [Pseudovibrio sp. Tun.PSC04-5.I4]
MNHQASAQTLPASPIDNLHSGNIKSQPYAVKAGSYERGQVLQYDAAGKRLEPLDDATKAGFIMPTDLELSVDTSVSVYVGGDDFNLGAMKFGGLDVDAVKHALRTNGILARNWQVR